MRTIKNPIERRLREVEEGRAELRAEIKRLERALKKPERLLELPHLLPATPPYPPRVRVLSSTGAASSESPSVAAPVPANEPAVDGSAYRSRAGDGDDRFRRYFASTRFFGPPAVGRERHVQRNRAILLLVGALILGFIVFRLIFH